MRSVASEKIRVWLSKPGNTQQRLAAKVAEHTGRPTNQSTVSAWASGKSVPNGLAMSALHAILRVPIADWMRPAPPAAAPLKTSTEG